MLLFPPPPPHFDCFPSSSRPNLEGKQKWGGGRGGGGGGRGGGGGGGGGGNKKNWGKILKLLDRQFFASLSFDLVFMFCLKNLYDFAFA